MSIATRPHLQVPAPMTRNEARDCIERIKVHTESIRGEVLELYERKGWKALGYSSWRECVTAEFEQSKSQLYRQLQAALIEREISPIGEKSGSIPEGQLRPLSGLRPEQQREAWKEAVETAPDGNVTAKHVEDVVARRQPPLGQGELLDDDARQQEKVERREPDRQPLPGQGELFADEPEPETSPADRWNARFKRLRDDIFLVINSIPRRGGIAKLSEAWPRKSVEATVQYLIDLRETIDRCINELSGDQS